MAIEENCRLCGLKLPLSCLKSIQELQKEQLDLLILQYLQITMNDNIGLPSAACELCCKTLYDFDQFLIKVHFVQQKFKTFHSQLQCPNSNIKLETKPSVCIIGNTHEVNDRVKIEDNNDNLSNDDQADSFPSNVEINQDNQLDNASNCESFEKVTEDNNVDRLETEDLDKNENNNKSLKLILLKCYKCNYVVQTSECLQDHFKIVHNTKTEYVCTECNALFDNLHEYEAHYDEHNVKEKKIYSCEVCGKQFFNSTNFYAHRDFHLGIKRFECDICGKKFTLKRHMEVHRITVCSDYGQPKTDINIEKKNDSTTISGKELIKSSNNMIEPGYKTKWKCDKCENYFYNGHILEKHIKNVHSIEHPEYTCTICKKLFDNIDKYKTHLKIVHNVSKKVIIGPTYKCEKCSKQFKYKTNYQAHILIHSGIKRFTCDKCGKKFTLKQHLTSHSISHLEPNMNEVKCNQCDKIFKTKSFLERHLKTHLPTDHLYIHKCTLCSRKFKTIEKLNTHHNKTHECEKKSICDICGKVLKNKHNLAYHIKSHNDEMPFKCDQCPKIFKSIKGLQWHKIIHTGETPYECEICGKRFPLRGRLAQHSVSHKDELPYECQYCKKRFKRKSHLTVHLRQHTGEHPYFCAECNHSFTNISNFIKHLKGRHALHNFSVSNQRRYPFNNQLDTNQNTEIITSNSNTQGIHVENDHWS